MAQLKFFWNGIKENGGKLQRCHYSGSQLVNHPAGTITIYARDYKAFSAGIREAFKVDDDSDYATDYVVQEHIRVLPDHPLYESVLAAMLAEKAHNEKIRPTIPKWNDWIGAAS
jgi:hypothetical protein